MHHLLPTSTSTDEGQRNTRAAVLPIGSFEQHGSYLPLITDSVIATTISAELAAAYPLLQLPPVTISCSHERSAWPGTVSISASTLLSVVTDVADSVHRSGTTALVLVNGHGGNYALSNLVQEANAHGNRMALFPTGQDWKDARSAAQLEPPCTRTCTRARSKPPSFFTLTPSSSETGTRPPTGSPTTGGTCSSRGMSAYTTSGVIGRPSLASAGKGKAVLASLVHSFADVLRALDL